MRPLLALALFAGGCCGAPLGGTIDTRPPEEVPCASDGYRPDDCRVFELGSDQFQLMVEDHEHDRRDAIEFSHQQLPKLCRDGFEVVSNGVSFKDDYDLWGDHQDVVVSVVIRCVRAPGSTSAPALAAEARRTPVVPVAGDPWGEPAPPAPAPSAPAGRRPVVPVEAAPVPAPASP